jgi:CubicO group peptidase (beta-lactamase class C family)
MTKSFTAAAVLCLRDDGLLTLDTSVGDLVPSLRRLQSPTEDAAPLTIRDLLGMSSGLVTDDPWADRHLDLTDDEFDRIIEDGPVFAGPTGDGFEYSNFGFAVLGRVVRDVAGVRVRDVVDERFLEPLGLLDTTWDRPGHIDHMPPVRADGTTPERPPLDDGAIAPMGGLWSTTTDLVRWATWLADAFPARDGADDGPLRRSSRREMQQPLRYTGRREVRGVDVAVSYGFGLHVIDDPEHGVVIGHSGGLPGYGSNMRWTRDGGVVLVALSNRTYAPMAELNARLHDCAVAEFHLGPTDGHAVAEHDEVLAVARRLRSVLERWSAGGDVADCELDEVFADNVAPDESYTERSEPLRRSGPFTFTAASTSGGASATLTGSAADGSTATVDFTVAPTRPLRIQRLRLVTEGATCRRSDDADAESGSARSLDS